jgi:hypothetical protein
MFLGWAIAGLVLVAGCDRGKPQANAVPAVGSVAAARPVGAPGIPATAKSGVASEPKRGAAPAPSGSAVPLQLTEEEAAREGRYRAGLAKGRKYTTAQDFPAAEAAFTEALAARPGDARALGERGFARLKAGKLEEAASDFNTADGRTADKTVAAQIFYNQGLVAERQGDLEAARVAFARSHTTHPTRASAQKTRELGATSCTVAVSHLSQRLVHYADWMALAKELMGEGHTYPTTKEAAWESLSVRSCADQCAAGTWRWDVVLPTEAGLDVLQGVDRGQYYRCGGPPEFTFARQGNILWVTSRNTEHETTVCDPNQCDQDYCPSCCADGPTHRYDIFIDLEARSGVLRLAQYSPFDTNYREVPVTLENRTVSATGLGCSLKIPLRSGR